MPQSTSSSEEDANTSHEWPVDLNLEQLPPIECVIGYGSGVFRQVGYENVQRPMVDLIFVVKDDYVKMWHDENLKRNADHYAGLAKLLGSNFVTQVQGYGPGVYFHPHVRLQSNEGEQLKAKYGVVTMSSLIRDLTDWTWLYLAGRMQKPVVLNWYGSDHSMHESLVSAVLANRRAALSAALLLNMNAVEKSGIDDCRNGTSSGWKSLGCVKLFESIVRLSYDGDIRVGIGEDPRKVQNIVMAQYSHLWRIYKPIAMDLGIDVGSVQPCAGQALLDSNRVRFDMSIQAQRKLMMELPTSLQNYALNSKGPDTLRYSLRSVVNRSSMQQTFKGVFTAGLSRSLKYSVAKIAKRLK